jgi:hypothetical protein
MNSNVKKELNFLHIIQCQLNFINRYDFTNDNTFIYKLVPAIVLINEFGAIK